MANCLWSTHAWLFLRNIAIEVREEVWRDADADMGGPNLWATDLLSVIRNV